MGHLLNFYKLKENPIPSSEMGFKFNLYPYPPLAKG